VFRYPGAGGFEQLSEWGGSFVATTLSTPSPTTLLVGDGLRSVILLKVNQYDGKLKEIARDYGAHGTTACCGLDESDEAYLAAEQDLNMLTLAWDEEGTIEAQGRFHLGELVNRLRPGRLASTASTVGPGAGRAHTVYATSSGSIGVVCALEQDTAQLASDLERNMRHAVGRGVGGLDQAEWVLISDFPFLSIILIYFRGQMACLPGD
jgi:DNA damage-binding protein 1